ncbi:K(+) efflux antiporter 3, chloroplastic isoform X3 [Lotus japonicus]|uniref:K(+) efflux antiporter 3, chloroplastic isoform X3 n=1 Tax=Lotus japonicus TaxID=34305 RepID=UPI002585CFCD|nr:K(+) efflux antiporter 3, chloroplastic isoform X3 [Lotus japonicus]
MLESLASCQSFKGYDLTKQKSPGYSRARSSMFMLYSVDKQLSLLSHGARHGVFHRPTVSGSFIERKPLSLPPFSGWKGFHFPKYRPVRWERLKANVAYDVADAVEVINDLGLDTLTFLAVTVVIVPTFKSIKASPILGFFCAGVVLNQFGLIRNITDVKALSEWGILFLVVLSTLAFTAFELPTNGAIGTKILQFLFHSRPDLVNIRSIDEAVVIGAALSLSSSAFVLQLLAEKGELPTRFGSATLGILLLQDLAVIPLLVILPILESQNMSAESVWPMLVQESLKALGGLGLLSLGAKFILSRVFQIVADTRSSEAFVALCLLTIAGTSLVTQHLGFSDTLGAFLAGAILAETNFRTQIEADIRPFRGLLLGLFFVSTGTSVDMQLLLREWPNVLALLGGLIAIKTLIITAIGPRVGLTLQESVRIGFLLSQGGEFGFVVFSLANRLGVLPLELNKLLIIVVVLSMALTPVLNEAGRRAAKFIDEKSEIENKQKASEVVNFNVSEPVVILGFGQMGQVLANFLSNPLASGGDSDVTGWPYVAFDLDPTVVEGARKLGFPILYGDGSRLTVLQSAGIYSPKAIMVMYTGKKKTIEAIQRLRVTFPAIPIYARARDLKNLLELKKAGATDAILENAETSLHLGSKLLKGLGVMSDDVAFLSQLIRDSMEIQAEEAINQSENRELDKMKPMQVRVSDFKETRETTSTEYELSVLNRKDQASLDIIQKEVDPDKQDYALNQAVKLEGNGVLRSKQGAEESSMVGSQDALGQKNLVDEEP